MKPDCNLFVSAFLLISENIDWAGVPAHRWSHGRTQPAAEFGPRAINYEL